MAHQSSGILVGDRNYWGRNYWGPAFAQQLREDEGVELIAPYRKSSQDPHPQRSRVLSRVRQSIEVMFGQLCERFKVKRMRARDIWHLSSQVLRALLTHTLCLLLNQLHHNCVHPLSFAQLLTP